MDYNYIPKCVCCGIIGYSKMIIKDRNKGICRKCWYLMCERGEQKYWLEKYFVGDRERVLQ